MSSLNFTIQANQMSYPMVLPHHGHDYIQGTLAKKGEPYELLMLQAMADLLQADDFVLDIGANIGNHTLFLAIIAKCKVESFEPNPELCDALSQSIELNRLTDKVTLHRVGVGAAPAKAHFAELNPENIGAQSLALDPEGTKDGFDIITIDSLNFKQTVRMVKIDVEGMELDVLEGAKELVARDKPIMFIEAQTQEEFDALLNVLLPLGYVYWDTFNATPTHLFFHEAELESDSYRTHMADMGINVTKLRYEVQRLRKQVNETGVCYRKALEQIEVLKGKRSLSSSAKLAAKEPIVPASSGEALSEVVKTFIKGQLRTERVDSLFGPGQLVAELGFKAADSPSSAAFLVDFRGQDLEVEALTAITSELRKNRIAVMITTDVQGFLELLAGKGPNLAVETSSQKYGVVICRRLGRD